MKKEIETVLAGIVLLTLLGCSTNGYFEEKRRISFNTKTEVTRLVDAGDCDQAFRLLDATEHLYADRYFRSDTHQNCGQHEQAIEVLLGKNAEVMSGIEALHLMDEFGLDLRVYPRWQASLFRLARSRARTGPQSPDRSHVMRMYYHLHHLTVMRLWADEQFDVGFLQWQVDTSRFASAQDPDHYYLLRRLASEEKNHGDPFGEIARERDRIARLEGAVEEVKIRGQALQPKLARAQFAYLARNRPWLQTCGYHYTYQTNVSVIEVPDTWTCEDGHCLLPSGQWPLTLSINRGDDAPLRFGAVKGEMSLIQGDIRRIDSNFGWRPRARDYSGGLKKIVDTYDFKVEPMDQQNCSVDYWLSERTGPTQTPFTRWLEDKSSQYDLPSWEWKPRGGFNDIDCHLNGREVCKASLHGRWM